MRCWCGAEGTYEELFSDDVDESCGGCGGSGIVNCYCGGDQCVCHNHGEADCPGCEECNFGDPIDDDDDDFYDD